MDSFLLSIVIFLAFYAFMYSTCYCIARFKKKKPQDVEGDSVKLKDVCDPHPQCEFDCDDCKLLVL